MLVTYTVVIHSIRNKHNLTWTEYGLLDIIYHLSTNPDSKVKGWCFASREYLAKEMGISKQAILNLIQKLIDEDFLEKDIATKFIRTLPKWNQVYFPNQTDGKETLPANNFPNQTDGKETLPAVKKLMQGGKETLPYSNTDNTNTARDIENPKIEDFSPETPVPPTNPENLDYSPISLIGKKEPIKEAVMRQYAFDWNTHCRKYPETFGETEADFLEWKRFIDVISAKYYPIWDAGRMVTAAELSKLKKENGFTPDKWQDILTEICGTGLESKHNLFFRIPQYLKNSKYTKSNETIRSNGKSSSMDPGTKRLLDRLRERTGGTFQARNPYTGNASGPTG